MHPRVHVDCYYELKIVGGTRLTDNSNVKSYLFELSIKPYKYCR